MSSRSHNRNNRRGEYNNKHNNKYIKNKCDSHTFDNEIYLGEYRLYRSASMHDFIDTHKYYIVSVYSTNGKLFYYKHDHDKGGHILNYFTNIIEPLTL